MVFTQQIAAEKRAFAWYLRTYSKFSYRRIADECRISKSSAHRICSNEFQHGSLTRMPSDKKRGRPRNVSERKMRLLIIKPWKGLSPLTTLWDNKTIARIITSHFSGGLSLPREDYHISRCRLDYYTSIERNETCYAYYK